MFFCRKVAEVRVDEMKDGVDVNVNVNMNVNVNVNGREIWQAARCLYSYSCIHIPVFLQSFLYPTGIKFPPSKIVRGFRRVRGNCQGFRAETQTLGMLWMLLASTASPSRADISAWVQLGQNSR